ncbi:type II secretion system F family protein [Candidatus Dojkabacteria bacterium]|nr:type II secretion system F family protein [Candidatus Dojkabacteria bacterium]
MANFRYIATKKTGERIEGEMEATSREEVLNALHGQDLIVVNIDDSIGFSLKKIGSVQIGGIPLKDKVFFTKQMSVMLSAGLPITQSLDILVQQTTNEGFRNELNSILEEVKGGNTLSSAFSKRKSMFNEVQLSLLRAGEQSGNLSEVITQISIDLEKSNDIQSKIRSAMIYPVIILVAVVVVLFVMILFMVPAVEELYADFGGAELPIVTRLLVAFGNFVKSPIGFISIVGGTGLIIFAFRYYRGTKSGREFTDKLLLKIPVFGPLNTKIQITQLTRLTHMLLVSGIPIIDTIKTVTNSMSNIHFQNALSSAAEDVSKGIPLAVPLSKSKYIPLIVSQMIATGEETGSLDQILESLAEFYDNEVNQITNNLTKLMEPLILLFVGGLVGLLAVAIYLPIYQIGQFVQ